MILIKNKKFFVCGIICLLVLIGAIFMQVPVSASAYSGTEYNYDNFRFTSVGNEYWVGVNTSIRSTITEANIPSTYKEKPVTQIMPNGFTLCKNLKTVTIPISIITIGEGAFADCWNLQDVYIEAGTTRGVKEIGAEAFAYCNLVDFIIPRSVTTIGEGAFEGNPDEGKISVRSETEGKFSTALATYGGDVVYGIDNLVLKYRPATNDYTVRSYQNIEIKNKPLVIPFHNTGNKDPNMDDGLKISLISSGAFLECELDLLEIGSCTKAGCAGHTITLDYKAFFGSYIKNIKLSDSVTIPETSHSVFLESSQLEKVSLPSSIQYITNYMFQSCTSLKEIKVNNKSANHFSTIISIGILAFEGCKELGELYFESNIDKIGNSAFAGCTKLSYLYISNMSGSSSQGGVSIGVGVFSDWKQEQKIEFGFTAIPTEWNGVAWKGGSPTILLKVVIIPVTSIALSITSNEAIDTNGGYTHARQEQVFYYKTTIKPTDASNQKINYYYSLSQNGTRYSLTSATNNLYSLVEGNGIYFKTTAPIGQVFYLIAVSDANSSLESLYEFRIEFKYEKEILSNSKFNSNGVFTLGASGAGEFLSYFSVHFAEQIGWSGTPYSQTNPVMGMFGTEFYTHETSILFLSYNKSYHFGVNAVFMQNGIEFDYYFDVNVQSSQKGNLDQINDYYNRLHNENKNTVVVFNFNNSTRSLGTISSNSNLHMMLIYGSGYEYDLNLIFNNGESDFDLFLQDTTIRGYNNTNTIDVKGTGAVTISAGMSGTVYGGNGLNNGAGKSAVYAPSCYVRVHRATLIGGNGDIGYSGKTATSSAVATVGGRGGTGGTAVVCYQLNLSSGTIIGGVGGKGGRGGDGGTNIFWAVDKRKGANGGSGGTGGMGVEASSIKSSGTIQGGAGGAGGSGGSGSGIYAGGSTGSAGYTGAAWGITDFGDYYPTL